MIERFVNSLEHRDSEVSAPDLVEEMCPAEIGRRAGYPELLARSDPERGWQGTFDPCPVWFKWGTDVNEHAYAMRVCCGRDWDPDCRGKAHDRRKARWYPKARQIESMGYINGTIPLERRRYYRDTRNLSALHSRWGRVLRERHGYTRGFRGWDWFGDPDKAPPGKPPKYHPHLGALVDGGHISDDKLKALKVSWAGVLGVPLHRSNLYYQYSDDPNKMMHWINYITRPTFLDAEWDPELAVRLIGFRTYQAWGRGKWDGEIKWDVPEGEAD